MTCEIQYKSTRLTLLDLVDDLEELTKVFLDNFVNKDETLNLESILSDIILKEKSFSTAMNEAKKQVKLQNKIDLVQLDIEKSDILIGDIQTELQNCENLLECVTFYGYQKMEKVQNAIRSPIRPSELITYGHRISSQHGTQAPENWQPGDIRRPYPIETQMRHGFLQHIDDTTGHFKPSIVETLANSLQPPVTVSPSQQLPVGSNGDHGNRLGNAAVPSLPGVANSSSPRGSSSNVQTPSQTFVGSNSFLPFAGSVTPNQLLSAGTPVMELNGLPVLHNTNTPTGTISATGTPRELPGDSTYAMQIGILSSNSSESGSD